MCTLIFVCGFEIRNLCSKLFSNDFFANLSVSCCYHRISTIFTNFLVVLKNFILKSPTSMLLIYFWYCWSQAFHYWNYKLIKYVIEYRSYFNIYWYIFFFNFPPFLCVDALLNHLQQQNFVFYLLQTEFK